MLTAIDLTSRARSVRSMWTISSGASNGRPRRSMPYTILNTVVVRPMPSASATTAMIVTPGLRRTWRSPTRMSLRKLFMLLPAPDALPALLREQRANGDADDGAERGADERGFRRALVVGVIVIDGCEQRALDCACQS